MSTPSKPEWKLRNEDYEAALRAGFRGDYIDWLESEVLRLRASVGQYKSPGETKCESS